MTLHTCTATIIIGEGRGGEGRGGEGKEGEGGEGRGGRGRKGRGGEGKGGEGKEGEGGEGRGVLRAFPSHSTTEKVSVRNHCKQHPQALNQFYPSTIHSSPLIPSIFPPAYSGRSTTGAPTPSSVFSRNIA